YKKRRNKVQSPFRPTRYIPIFSIINKIFCLLFKYSMVDLIVTKRSTLQIQADIIKTEQKRLHGLLNHPRRTQQSLNL
ncbi:hypothetical protein VU11_07245, partial [Desulfobulbus sp. US2]|nr:hypothetical protein [Desulfobulbus sp. US2]